MCFVCPQKLSLGFSWYFAKYHKIRDLGVFMPAFQNWAVLPQPFHPCGQISDRTCTIDLGKYPEDSLCWLEAGPEVLAAH